MKVKDLQLYLAGALEKWGNIECYIDVDPEDDDLYELDGVYADMASDNEKDVNLVFAAYETRAKLLLVK